MRNGDRDRSTIVAVTLMRDSSQRWVRTNCDFAAHLRGRIGHLLFLNEHRGRKLLKICEAIDWTR